MTIACTSKGAWLLALALGLGACAPSTERTWQKAGSTPAGVERDEAECLTAAGAARVPQVHPGTAGLASRDVDLGGRGSAEYVACMVARGYTRPHR